MSSISFIFICMILLGTSVGYHIYTLQDGEDIIFPKSRSPELQIFCYPGKQKHLSSIWLSVSLHLNHSSDDFTLYDGKSPEAVLEEHQKNRYSFNILSSKQRNIRMDPFNQTCVGVESREKYSVVLKVIRVDFWKMSLLFVGIGLYFSARVLCKSPIFFYISGIFVGIFTSFLLLVYFISKLFSKKPFMYGFAVFGWSVGVYFLQMLFDNTREILLNYKTCVIWYTVVTGIISFIVCYRWGPVENKRTLNLMRWGLQGISLVAIFFSTQFQEAAMGIILIVLLYYNVPSSWLLKPKTYWKNRFPPKVRRLTMEEYYEQGIKETANSLEELRKFCSSPECEKWKLALQLKDVKRFASFVEGTCHFTEEEIREYERTLNDIDLLGEDAEYTDDEPDEEESGETED